MPGQTVPNIDEFISKRFPKKFFSKTAPCAIVELFVHSPLSVESREMSILFEV